MKWKDEKIKMDVNKNFKTVITNHITKFGYHHGFVVNGCAKCEISQNKGITIPFKSLHCWCGMLWFLNGNYEDNMFLASINGFFQLRSCRVPTKMLVEDEGKTIEEIYDNKLDDNTPMSLLHASNKYMVTMTWRWIWLDIVWGGDDRHHFVVGMEAIVGPLMEVSDMDEKWYSFCALWPYCYWDNFFSSI